VSLVLSFYLQSACSLTVYILWFSSNFVSIPLILFVSSFSIRFVYHAAKQVLAEGCIFVIWNPSMYWKVFKLTDNFFICKNLVIFWNKLFYKSVSILRGYMCLLFLLFYCYLLFPSNAISSSTCHFLVLLVEVVNPHFIIILLNLHIDFCNKVSNSAFIN
jgi:hypothetical protein